MSPLDVQTSPRLFWQDRDSGSPFQRNSENQAPYDPDMPFAPLKRQSLENLKCASKVKNSSMFRDHQQEYDPTQVYVPQRPLASGRPLPKYDENDSASQQLEDQAVAQFGPRPPSPSKDQASPAKSSLSKASRFGSKNGAFNPGSEIWSDTDDQRHAKSVTFDAAPPQINEYEMTTPDPSSIASGSHNGDYDSEEDDEEVSFDRDSLTDRDDSFDASLEDIEKTPVVLPEDWRFISPSNANDELVKEDEDPFTELGSPSPEPRPSTAQKVPARHNRVGSFDSNGERRPLPPLPSTTRLGSPPRPSSRGKLGSPFELGSAGQRLLPGLPGPASHSKSEISDAAHTSMSLEDRVRLMMIKDQAGEGHSSGTEEQGDGTNLANVSDRDIKREVSDTERTQTNPAYQPGAPAQDFSSSPPRISRDSILRDIRKSDSFLDDSYECSSQIDSSSRHDMHYDPDVPVPSVENDSHYDEDDDTNSVIVKQEEIDEDLYSIPQYYEQPSSQDPSLRDLHSQGQDTRHGEQDPKSDEKQSTPIPDERAAQGGDQGASGEAQVRSADTASVPSMAAMRDSLQRPMTPTGEDGQVSEPSTPDSVIRHSVEDDDGDSDDHPPSEPIPDPLATVKAPGTGLKTRPSFTPADMEAMAATRRKVSGQQPPPTHLLDKEKNRDEPKNESLDDQHPESNEASQQLALPLTKDSVQRKSSLMKLDVPFSIQEESLGFGLDKEFDRVIETQKVAFELSLSRSPFFPLPATQTQGYLSLSPPGNRTDLSRPYSGISADQAIPKQRGYLMRHNTKVIVASSGNDEEPAQPQGEAPPNPRGTRSAGSSPRKASQQTWTTEPWNGKTRRSSMRTSSGVPKKKPVPGAAPPLPGQHSNVQGPAAVIEENEPALDEALEDGEERGRLFVKVVGMKYLDLPLPRGKNLDRPEWLEIRLMLISFSGERSYFALTLDNGLHCVTTSWLELGKTAPIGQEFELIVQNDLEFHFTLQMKVDQAKLRPQEAAPASPTRQKASTFSRVFASPRKRKELELKQQQATQQQKGTDLNAGVWEKLRTLIARDGSFARAYVALSDHEKHAFGRPYTVDIACFNEWAVDEQPSSVKSKKSASSATSQRRPPYKIGKLELQLLFVPKPKGAKDGDMPKSMNACIREMRDAETISSRTFEGCLSQQGGDCPVCDHSSIRFPCSYTDHL